MKFLRFLLAAVALCAVRAAAAADAPAKPNIIFILADDLGIGNVSCYGADHFQTPNIDTFAKTGLRFEHCYSAPLCGPSRALLMTGRYAFRTGMTGNETGALLKPTNEIMMPTLLKPAGYVTGMCGKWSQLPLQPSDWGFDEYLRFNGSGKYWNTQTTAKNYMVNGKRTPLRDGEYLPDKMHEFVIDFINRHKDHPFYLYYSMSHIHQEILPTPDSKPNSKTLYKDNITYMDKLVGKLLAELDRLKLRDNTIIVFAGDNGTATAYYQRSTVNGKIPSGHKGTMLECGALVPCIVSWPGIVAADKTTPALINICDFVPTLVNLAGGKLPANVTYDGRDFSASLRGQTDAWPRDWIFVELGRHWFDRDIAWKLNESSNLFDMRGAPFAEPLVPADTKDETAIAERKKLQAILDQLNPAGGYLDPGAGEGKGANTPKRQAKKAAKKAAAANPNASENANEKDQ